MNLSRDSRARCPEPPLRPPEAVPQRSVICRAWHSLSGAGGTLPCPGVVYGSRRSFSARWRRWGARSTSGRRRCLRADRPQARSSRSRYHPGISPLAEPGAPHADDGNLILYALHLPALMPWPVYRPSPASSSKTPGNTSFLLNLCQSGFLFSQNAFFQCSASSVA